MNTPTSAGTQMDTNKKMREYISAFADGELPDADLELALAALREPDGQAAWELYHRIGDALRDEPGASSLSPGFAARLAGKLDAESVPLRRAAGKPASSTDALAVIAPAVAAGADAANGSKLAVAPAAPHEGPVAEPGAAAVKRL